MPRGRQPRRYGNLRRAASLRPRSAEHDCAADAWCAARLHAPRHGAAGLAFLIGCAGLLAIAFVWFSLSLHVRRIRDIGWDPVVVLVGVFALDVGDAVLAHLMPSLAHGRHGRTVVGGLLSGALSLALLFWPSGDRRRPRRIDPARPGRGPRASAAIDGDDPPGRLRPARPRLRSR